MTERISSFAERLKEALKDDKATNLADRIGLSKQAISMYVNGKRIPKRPVIESISRELHVNPMWLMGYDVDMHLETKQDILAGEKKSYRRLFSICNEYPEYSLMGLSNICRRERIQKDWTEKHTASLSDVPIDEYLDFENSFKNIGPEKILRILKTLELDESYLIGSIQGYILGRMNGANDNRYDKAIIDFDISDDIKDIYNLLKEADNKTLNEIIKIFNKNNK
jgi:transcriptional regulator with XRE-family HTH domain